MKIGVDISVLFDKYYSGVSEYAYNLIKELLNIDKKNEYVLYYNSFKDLELKNPIKADNVRMIKTAYPNKIFNYGMQKIFHYPKIDKAIGGVDMFFSPHLNFYSLSKDCYKIITIHDVSFLHYPEFFSLRKNLWHTAINIRKLLKKYDKIIAVSENTKQDLIELCSVPSEKISVIYSGLDKSLFSFNENIALEKNNLFKIKEKYRLPEKYIFYIGNIEPRKNIETIIKAFDVLRENTSFDYELIIAGAKCWKSNRTIKAWQDSKNKNKIRFLGYVDKVDKKYLYESAALFVYPSFYEGFGFPPLEAIACGCPTIIGASSSLAEIVGKGAIMVDVFNINSLARAMKESLENNRLKTYFSKNSANFKLNFTWEKSAERHLALFENSANLVKEK